MISVQCPSCKKVHSSPESMLGKKVRCNDCHHVFVVTHDAGLVEVTPTTNLPPHVQQKPVAEHSSRKMIQYQCPRCKSKLKSSSHLSGMSDVCPVCKFTVAVPLLRKPNWLLRVALVAVVVVIGAAAFVILNHGWDALKLPVSASSAAHQLTGTGGGEGTRSGDWGNQVSVRIVGENQNVQTTFLMGFKDAWYSGQTADEKNNFVLVYYYKNLGPREESEPLGWWDVKKEIKTDKGHIFTGYHFSVSNYIFTTRAAMRPDAGGWYPKETSKIEETGESALVFAIPKGEVPTEMIAGGQMGDRRVDLNLKLPQRHFGTRRYDEAFGFLPQEPEKAVSGLIEALQDKDEHIRITAMGTLGKIGPAAKEAVPTLIEALQDKNAQVRGASLEALGRIGPAAKDAVSAIINVLSKDDHLDNRETAAKVLGQLGPAAKQAVPALKEALQTPRWSVQYGGAYVEDLYKAVNEALAKIDDQSASVPASSPEAPPQPEEPIVSSSEPTKPTPPEEPSTGFRRSRVTRRLEAPLPPEEPIVSSPEPTKPMLPKEDNTAAEESELKHEYEPTVFVSSRSGFHFKIVEAKRVNNGSNLKFTILIRSQNQTRLMKLVEPKETAYIVDPNGNKYRFISTGGTLWTESEREENKVIERKPLDRSRRRIEPDRDRQRRESNPPPSYNKFLADVDIKCYMTFLSPPPTVKKISLFFTFAYDKGMGESWLDYKDDALFKDLNLEKLIVDVPQDANK